MGKIIPHIYVRQFWSRDIPSPAGPTTCAWDWVWLGVQSTINVLDHFGLFKPHSDRNMSLADYLAKNYLTADSDKKSKKRKRKHKDGGLKIDDDDDISGWNKGRDDDDDDAPTIGKFSRGTRISFKLLTRA